MENSTKGEKILKNLLGLREIYNAFFLRYTRNLKSSFFTILKPCISFPFVDGCILGFLQALKLPSEVSINVFEKLIKVCKFKPQRGNSPDLNLVVVQEVP